MSRREATRVIAVYRLLWRLYPGSFRARFEDPAVEVFEARYSDERARGRIPASLFLVRSAFNVLVHGVIERVSSAFARDGVSPAGGTGADLVQALRSARRSLRHHVAAILCIALGLAVTSAILTLVSSTLLRPLPFPDAERLVRVWSVEEGVELAGRGQLSYPDVVDLAASLTSLEPLVASGRSRVMFLGDDGARRVEGEAIGPGYLSLLGVEPFLGRGFSPTDHDPTSPPTMILSFGTWVREFGADPEIIGQSVRTADGPFTVIGVMPQDFIGTIEADIPDLEFWIPLEHYLSENLRTNRSAEFIWTIGRLTEGATIEEARSQAVATGDRLIAEGRLEAPGGYWIEPFGENWRAELRSRNYLLLAAAGLLLLVAATNVAGLLVARVMGRQRELALMAALGAGRERLLRQTLFETMAVVAIGGALGVALAPWLLSGFMGLAPDQLPAYLDLTPDARSLTLSFVVLAVTAVAAGVTPALLSGRAAPASVLGGGGRTSTQGRSGRRTTRWLVVGEVAITTVLVSSAALLVDSYRTLGATDVGFRSEDVAKLAVFIDSEDIPDNATLPTFYDDLRTTLTQLDGVEEVGFASPTVPPGFSTEIRVRFDGMPDPSRENGILGYGHLVDGGFFSALDIPILAGRAIDRSDDGRSRPVAVVSESLAESMGGAEEAVGRLLDLGEVQYEVVGVAGDVLYLGATQRRPRDIDVYFSLAQDPVRVVAVALRTSVDPATVLGPARTAIARLTPRSPLDWVATMPADLTRGFEGPRFMAVLLFAFAGSALLLTAAGVFAVLAHKVAGERAEMGIRRAFGARRSDLVGVVVRSGATLCAVGVLIGTVLSLMVSGGLGRILFGAAGFDLRGTAVAAVVILTTGVLASLTPALRAMRADPVAAMRDG